MKKILKIIIASIIFSSMLAATAFSDGAERIYDPDGVLFKEGKSAAEERLSKIYNEFGFDIITVIFSDSETDAEEEGMSYISENGYAEAKDGIILSINAETGDYWIKPLGRGNETFSEYGIGVLYDETEADFADGDFYEGINVFIKHSEKFISQAEETGEVYDASNEYKSKTSKTLIIAVFIIAGMFLAMGVTHSMKKGMKIENLKEDSNDAAEKRFFAVTDEKDIYLYSEIDED